MNEHLVKVDIEAIDGNKFKGIVDINNVEISSPRSVLTEDQKKRAYWIYRKLDGNKNMKMSASNFVADFDRECTPEREITIWERLAIVYQKLKSTSKYKNSDLYFFIMLISTGSVDSVKLSRVPPEILKQIQLEYAAAGGDFDKDSQVLQMVNNPISETEPEKKNPVFTDIEGNRRLKESAN